MINGQKEIWISTGSKHGNNTIIAISNCGRLMRKSGKIEVLKYRQVITYYGEKESRAYKILAEYFIRKTENDKIMRRLVVDHKTHNPKDMFINDIRNLRWCTNKENCNFTECKLNQRSSAYTHFHTEFGYLYWKTYGIAPTDNRQQYNRVYSYYKYNGYLPEDDL